MSKAWENKLPFFDKMGLPTTGDLSGLNKLNYSSAVRFSHYRPYIISNIATGQPYYSIRNTLDRHGMLFSCYCLSRGTDGLVCCWGTVGIGDTHSQGKCHLERDFHTSQAVLHSTTWPLHGLLWIVVVKDGKIKWIVFLIEGPKCIAWLGLTHWRFGMQVKSSIAIGIGELRTHGDPFTSGTLC